MKRHTGFGWNWFLKCNKEVWQHTILIYNLLSHVQFKLGAISLSLILYNKNHSVYKPYIPDINLNECFWRSIKYNLKI